MVFHFKWKSRENCFDSNILNGTLMAPIAANLKWNLVFIQLICRESVEIHGKFLLGRLLLLSSNSAICQKEKVFISISFVFHGCNQTLLYEDYFISCLNGLILSLTQNMNRLNLYCRYIFFHSSQTPQGLKWNSPNLNKICSLDNDDIISLAQICLNMPVNREYSSSKNIFAFN